MYREREEDSRTTGGQVDIELRTLGVVPTEEVTQDIVSNVGEAVRAEIEEREEQLVRDENTIFVSKQEAREFIGAFSPKGTPERKKEALKQLSTEYRLKVLNEGDQLKEEFYKGVRDTARLKADYIRLEINKRVEGEEANAMLKREAKENDFSRLERFKKWAKENMVGLSAVVISIAGSVTSLVVHLVS